MFDSILVVCAGNICRSPTAKGVFDNLLKHRFVEVTSAGLTALEGHEADENAIRVTNKNGISLAGHKGKQLTAQLVTDNALILVMEQRHLDYLCTTYPVARGKIFLLAKWTDNTDIPDPYMQSPESFEYVFDLIKSACSAWQKYILVEQS
jgi:protein-tyrosine phosphatase